MGFLNWMKKQERAPESETETGPPFGLTKKGNPIEPVRSSDWQSDPVGVHETRTHIGKSSEGFHGGFQVVPAGGDGDIGGATHAKQKRRPVWRRDGCRSGGKRRMRKRPSTLRVMRSRNLNGRIVDNRRSWKRAGSHPGRNRNKLTSLIGLPLPKPKPGSTTRLST